MFEPENSLEALMQAAGKDPGVAPTFYRHCSIPRSMF